MPDPTMATPTAPTTDSSDALHRLTARLATLDLDPPTIEILTAVLTIDLDPSPVRSGEGRAAEE
jgi:hypothetical protein